MRTKVRLALVLVVAAAVAVGGLLVLDKLGLSVLGTNRESSTSEVIAAVTREQQVALVGLGIQGIHTEKVNTDVWGLDIPGSGKIAYIQYGFDAKLGIEGEDVQIEKRGAAAYVVTIPEFTFIGYDDVEFETVVEKDGVLSSMTADIDTAEVITEILNDDTKDEYVSKNVDLLQDQAKVFYEGIIRGIDPTIEVEFAYAGDPA